MKASQSGQYTGDALASLEREECLLRKEQQAFRRFERFIAVQARTTNITPAATSDHSMATLSGQSTGIQHVRDRYREIVMDVIGPEGETDESIDSHLEGELTAELSAALRHNTTFTPQLRDSLLLTIRAAQTAREDVLGLIDSERKRVTRQQVELAEVNDEISRIEETLGEAERVTDLVALYDSLETVEKRCDAIVRARQHDLQTLSFTGPIARQGIHEYLYRDLDVTYPVLAETTGVASKSRTLREGIERRIATVE